MDEWWKNLHIGRSWAPHTWLEDKCPCVKELCGLVNSETADPNCPEHALKAYKTMRQGHRADECPGRRTD